ncbi:MAG TPA: transposase, partial [Anaerovoracaceae bacterium]|nr:transposase [Anaerovoracaceae bacterium]
MYSVGIDIAKEKSVVAILTECEEIVAAPKTYEHTRRALLELSNGIRGLDGEVRIVLEATGAYHLPVVTFLQEQGFFVAVINPF